MSNLIGQSLGRYHILEKLGEGGMAVVYKAFDTKLEREVALKIIRVDAILPNALERTKKRFEREAKALAKLNHPNIVPIMDSGQEGDTPYLVMGYIPGGTLKKKITGNPLPWREAAQLLIPIAQALAYSHKQGIVHRDIKPLNILITAENEPMLTDFGIARILQQDETLDLTGTGMGVGTPEYMAPEQGLGHKVDHRADIYALGIIFYEMLTGRKPFQADTPMAVVVKQINDPLPRPEQFASDIPDDIQAILLKMLAKKPEYRYQELESFIKDFEKLLEKKKWGKKSNAMPNKAKRYAGLGLLLILVFFFSFQKIYQTSLSDIWNFRSADMLPTLISTVSQNSDSKISTSTPSTSPTSTITDIPSPTPTIRAFAVQAELINSLSQPGVKRVAWSPDGTYIAAVGRANFYVWDPINANAVEQIEIPLTNDSELLDVDWSPDGDRIAISTSKNGIYLVDTKTYNMANVSVHYGQLETLSAVIPNFIEDLCWSTNGKKIAIAATEVIVVLDAGTGDKLVEIQAEVNARAVAWSLDDTKIVVSGVSGLLYFDAETGEKVQSTPLAPAGQYRSIEWSPDNSLVAAAYEDGWSSNLRENPGAIYLAKISGEYHLKLRGHKLKQITLDWYPDGVLLASGGGDMSNPVGSQKDSEVYIWDTNMGEIITVLSEPNQRIWSVRWSPDGRYLIASGEDDLIYIWRIVITS